MRKLLSLAFGLIVIVAVLPISGWAATAADPDTAAREATLLQGTPTPPTPGEPIDIQDGAMGALSELATAPATPPAVEWIDIGNGMEFYYYFAESRFALYLLGEVRNNNAEAVPSPFLLVTMLDGQGNIVGSTYPIDMYPIVAAGGTTPYQVVVDDVIPGSWETEIVEVQGYGQGPAVCTSGLELQDIVEVEKSVDQFRVNGKVYNGGSLPLDGVHIYVAVYTMDGVYAGMSNESIQAVIPPGKTAAFSVFGLRVPGLLLPESDPDYTYRVFATNITGGAVYC